MPEYLATYRVQAYEHSLGGSRPYEKKAESRFPTEDDENALEKAQERRFEIGRGLLRPTVTLERLVAIREVTLSPLQAAQTI